jgi:HlyD family secretion protein
VDIALDQKILTSRTWQARGRWGVLVATTLTALLLFRHWLAPSMSREEIRTAIVDRGPVSTEVRATGTVVPVHERVLISPVTSTIIQVYLPVGSVVKQGDAILKLDSAQTELQVTRLVDELRLKDLEIEGLRQQQRRSLQELRGQEALARLDLENHNVIFDRYERLVQSNTVSRFDHETARLNARKTKLALEQLTQKVTETVQSDSNALSQRAVQRQLIAQQLAEQQKLLRDTTIRADGNGILTVLHSEVGRNVVAGSELARISDLSSFRVDATLSDFYLHQISTGLPVKINIGTGDITGRIEQILPAVDNGTLRLRIALDEPANAQLKPNQRIEAAIVTESRSSGLRVANGIVFNGSGLQDVFVVQGEELVRRQVEVGLTNASHVEIVSGLSEGDVVVISDMADKQHLDRLSLN